MGSMASNPFTQQAQNDLVENLENVQVGNDIFIFWHIRKSLFEKCFDMYF